ncbi:hypothetical protein [Extensimonas perlucida]|uniref:hypothetical protein n=1 Tax=Extensimonas perlucida TaxID=2590786 RepID=UPI00119DFFAA|nr:hypothetical protein [Extensimonas perlucida]
MTVSSDSGRLPGPMASFVRVLGIDVERSIVNEADFVFGVTEEKLRDESTDRQNQILKVG